MKKIWLGVCLLWAVPVMASDIQAIVNDTPISEFDVKSRAQIIMFQQKGKLEEITPAMKQMALDDLIDERIKQQEALRQNISVSDDEVSEALAHLEEQNGLERGGFRRLLAEQNIPYQTLFNQTAANLAWLKVLQRTGRLTPVTEAEIRARQDLMRDDLKQEKVSFAEIVVPTKEEADKIWTDLQNGADFHSIVMQKSVAMSRNSDGEVINVSPNIYGEKVAVVLKDIPVGQLSKPLEVKEGYALILMLDKRPPLTGDSIQVWEMTQAILSEGSKVNATMTKGLEGCEEFQQIAFPEAVKGTFKRGQVAPMQLPADVKDQLQSAEMGVVVGPVQTQFGKLYLMKCQEVSKRVIPTDEELRAQIEAEKMELLSRQFIAELKRGAVIEYK